MVADTTMTFAAFLAILCLETIPSDWLIGRTLFFLQGDLYYVVYIIILSHL